MIASAFLVAYSLWDLMQPLHPAAPTQPDTVYSETGAGQLQVSVNSVPLSGSVPIGATRVQLATINFSASCDANVTIDSVVLTHLGLGKASDISAVYLTDGFRRLTRAGHFDDHSQTAQLRAQSLVIPKCGAVRLQALVDISPDATPAAEHGLTIATAADVRSNAKSVTLLAQDASEKVVAAPNKAGAVTVNFLPISGPLRYGRQETVARIQFSADSKNSYLLKKITLTNQEDARDMDLINFQIQTRSGSVLTPLAQRMRGKEVTLEFSPTYILNRGQTVVLLVKAEIHGSQSSKVNFALQEPSDLETNLYRPRWTTQ